MIDQELSKAPAQLDRLERAAEPPSLDDFFRKEAIDDARQSMGAPVRLLGVAGYVLCFFFVALLAVMLAFVITAKYARKETVFGQVTPTAGAFRITSQHNGIAERVMVHEGQLVKARDQMITISSNPMMLNGESLAAGLKTIQLTQRREHESQAIARLELAHRQIEELKVRRDGFKLDLIRLNDARKLLERRMQLQVQNLAANRSLAEMGMVSSALVRQHEDALLAIEQQIQQADREYAHQRSQLALIEPQIGRVSAEAALARSAANSASAQLNERALNSDAQLSHYLAAPIDGVVHALQIRAGAPISAGQTLAIVVPGSASHDQMQLEVELWAPSRAIGFVKPGAKVRIMYDAFPYQNFGVGKGLVRDVSGAPVSPNDLPVPIETREQLFRIRVKLDKSSLGAYGRDWPLVPGMRLSADLILEEQSLLDWILGPLRAANKRFN